MGNKVTNLSDENVFLKEQMNTLKEQNEQLAKKIEESHKETLEKFDKSEKEIGHLRNQIMNMEKKNSEYDQNKNNIEIKKKSEGDKKSPLVIADEINECLAKLRKENSQELGKQLNKLLGSQMEELSKTYLFNAAYAEIQNIFTSINNISKKYSLKLTDSFSVFEELRKALLQIAEPYKEISKRQAGKLDEGLKQIYHLLDRLFPKSYGLGLQKQYLELAIDACKKTIFPGVPENIRTSKYFLGFIFMEPICTLDWYRFQDQDEMKDALDKLRENYVKLTFEKAKKSNSSRLWLICASSQNSTEKANIFFVVTSNNESFRIEKQDNSYSLSSQRYLSWKELVVACKDKFGDFIIEEPKNGEVKTIEASQAF